MTLSRPALHRITAGEVERQGIALDYGKRLCALEDGEAGIVARFEDGSEVRGDLVVGADGINSRVREIIAPTGRSPRSPASWEWVASCRATRYRSSARRTSGP